MDTRQRKPAEESAMEFGPYSVSAFVSEHLGLDGGAMFGSVPKVLWGRRIVPDDQNRIPLACRLLVLEGEGRKILVDLGCGNKWSDKERSIYDISHQSAQPLASALPGITDIIVTHLHFDHVGGISYRDADGALQL
ncbi:MAG: MBL fold metallo-hydrolase, partial [Bdellovibrionales bacterium]|nr:MBL fold metallo-hydrolase [Bdellovibrionales bacterium]